MVLSCCKAGDKIILPRNVHKSVINALVLCGAIPVYVNPEVDNKLGISLGMQVAEVEPQCRACAEHQGQRVGARLPLPQFGALGVGELVDSTHVSILGEEFEYAPVSGIDEGTEVEARVAFDRIDLLDHAEDGVTGGAVYMILYKGDHYHLTIRTDSDEFVYVDTNDVWDKGDIVGINILPQDLIVTARNGKEE